MFKIAETSRTDAFCVSDNQMVKEGDPRNRQRLFYITTDHNICVMVSTRHLDGYAQESPTAHNILIRYSPLRVGRLRFG